LSIRSAWSPGTVQHVHSSCPRRPTGQAPHVRDSWPRRPQGQVQHVHASRHRRPPRQGPAVPATHPRRLSPPESYFSASLRFFCRHRRHRRHYVHRFHQALRLPGVRASPSMQRLPPAWPCRRLVQVQHVSTSRSRRVTTAKISKFGISARPSLRPAHPTVASARTWRLCSALFKQSSACSNL
jgi:hypothetical protein